MKKIFSLLIILVLASVLLSGCKKDKGDPPTLPPVKSMEIDFSNFETGKKSSDIVFPKGIENSNWEFAALVAGYWRAIIFTTLAVPVLSYHVAINQVPAYLSDRMWEWSYDASVLSVTYKARLTGQIRTDDVDWKMYISKEGGTGAFNDFLWFTGSSKLDGTGGQWTLNYSPQFKEPVLQIDWTTTGTEIGTIKYTYIRTLNDSRQPDLFKTSYIEYGKQTGLYDSYYKIHYYNGADFSDMEVEWNSTGYNGKVKCLQFFTDDEWHCWDGNYVNITCPEK
jgi:hypothetical protein